MADYQSPGAQTSNTNSTKSKKRKLPDSKTKQSEKASKSSRNNQFNNDSLNQPIEEDKDTSIEALEDSSPWRNLQLVLSLQKKNLDIEKKVELAYDFVKLSFNQVEEAAIQSSEAVSFERVITFLNNWIQSTLISSEKNIRVDGHEPKFGVSGSCLDYRCWKIFEFCLEEGTRLNVSLSFARDILRVLHCVAKNTEIKEFDDDESTLYNTILNCISSIFTSHGGVSNENLDLWILLAGTVLELVLKVITNKLEDSRSGSVVLHLTCLVLEPFAKFLRLHPNKKNGFHDFVDRLLEPLLHLLHVTHRSVISTSSVWISKLLKLNEEVLCQGLFHPSHIDGFMSLHSLTKYKLSDDGRQKDSKTVIKSYHRHLFDKFGRIITEKKAFALFGVGELFRLYVRCIKRQEGVDVPEGSRKYTDGLPKKSQHVLALSSEIRKSLFDFFVQITQPFVGDIDTYLKDETDVGSVLEDVHYTLKSVNSILISLIEEEVYAKVDDTSEGACGNFLKLVCDKVTLLSAKLSQIVLLTFDVNDNGKCKEFMEAPAKELILCLNYLLEIDYEVLGNDLEGLWLLMFSYGTVGHTSANLLDKSSVISEIIRLGCHMVNLYSELRQVGTCVFALCKAIRRLVSYVRDINVNNLESSRSSLYHSVWTQSLRLILCSSELRLSMHNAVRSIPEGQVSLCIQELATDLSESLEWMKGNLDNSCQDMKTELLGSGLSEVYALILDSLMVTSGNSSHVGVPLNDLIAVIRPVMTVLISKQKNGVQKFLLEVSGCEDGTIFSHWIFVFIFCLYLSSRSLYRQAVSLAPPTTSKKMSELMRDTFTAYSGNEWLEKPEKDNGYFSWISESSVSLLSVIEASSDICYKESAADTSPLTYVLSAMIIQRLVDLNRLVNSFEFAIKRHENEDGIHSTQHKRLQKRLLKLREEAAGLVNVMTGHFSLFKACQLDYSCDIVVAAMDKKSLPCAIWCIFCQNVDIWSMHAAKKKLKTFLSILLQNSLVYASNSFKQFGEHINVEFLNSKKVTGREISLELLSNTMFYEEKFVRKLMASRFCKFLKQLVSPLFNSRISVELQEHTDWPKELNFLKMPSVVSNNIKKISNKQEVDVDTSIYAVCETSLRFLSWMPKRRLSSKSFSLYVTCILNLERGIVGTLLGYDGDPLSCDRYDLLRLFLCCRRTLKNLMVTYCEENMGSSQNSLEDLHFKGKFPALWLLESFLSVQNVFSKDATTLVNGLMVSLMDYTSYVFLTLTKGSFVHASHSLISSRKPFQQKDVVSTTSDQEDSIKASDFVIHVAEALKDHSQIMLTCKTEEASRTRLLKLSSVTACFQGFLWGLSSALCYMDAHHINLKAVFLRRNFEPVDKLKLCIDTYTAFVEKLLCELVLQDDKLPEASRSFCLEDVDTRSVRISNIFSRVLSGENLEAAFFIRQLFITYSAILKLNLLIKTSLSTDLVNRFLGISEILLLEFSSSTETSSEFVFVFLDGIGKFLEELANHVTSTNSTLPTKVYEKLVDLHLKAIGKCISLQQKGATLESHETESSTKTMNHPENAYSSLDEFKTRLRMSFKVLVGKSSELYTSCAVQSIKKALIGLPDSCMANYQIYTGNSGGGKVSSVVAAGIDCLDVVLEAITGRKGLSTVKTEILGSVCCLFNILCHLQSRQIFYKNPVSDIHNCADPDSGSVVLMCIEVLTKVSGKHALYQMDARHVAQALSIPATLFRNFLQLTKTSGDKLLDRSYSMELYAACCRMLYTFLRHHKRESLQQIALLQASVSVLLHCLEMVDKEETVHESLLVWRLQEGVKCGAFLRRIYEEIRQQKDVIGQDCRLFLSSYIGVYSGYGPRKVGIRREIDEALRPGVYALIDACSPEDLQYLHTAFGEGPCRNTLANLQHDYKINFQYQGKV